MEKENKLSFIILFSSFFFLFSPTVVQAATLYFSPASGAYEVGSLVTVNVYVSSAAQSLNAASGVISFSTEKLETVSLSKAGSIFNLWVQEPAFSNTLGTVNFEGIVLNPGFVGSSGKVISVTFRIKAAGSTRIIFSSGSVLANDGKGTNILAEMSEANFSVGAISSGAQEAVARTTAAGAPAAPKISSPTHPDSDKWYTLQDAKFSWDLPKDVNGVRLLISRNPQANPTVTYIPPLSFKEVSDVDDGIWYLAVQFRNGKGWGVISRFKFQIDTKKPEPFDIKFVDGKETFNPRPVALFHTMDSLSGLDYYRIKIGEGEFLSVPSEENVVENPYMLPPQPPGRKLILVQALDKAGNYNTASEELIIKALETPKITDYARKLQSGDMLIVKGKTVYPGARVSVWLARDDEEVSKQVVQSDQNGEFVFIAEEKLQDGVYKLWAEVEDERGARSEPSEKILIAAERPVLIRIGSRAIGFLAVLIPLVALFLLLTATAWYGWYRFAVFRKKVGQEVRATESALHKAFFLLKEAVREQLKTLEKTQTRRQLTEEEEKVISRLKKDLDDAEKFLRKGMEDIAKEIK